MTANIFGSIIYKMQLQTFSQKALSMEAGMLHKDVRIRRCCHFQQPANANQHLKMDLF